MGGKMAAAAGRNCRDWLARAVIQSWRSVRVPEGSAGMVATRGTSVRSGLLSRSVCRLPYSSFHAHYWII
jgi:hypothetical protein